ncbi:hypothetical protein GQ53DRAFT_32800 [Thozetella sp. PMI_491]|nr:hypothetical protein GQ53DRAFT_32800 [Thozetella sp. PMI_491]
MMPSSPPPSVLVRPDSSRAYSRQKHDTADAYYLVFPSHFAPHRSSLRGIILAAPSPGLSAPIGGLGSVGCVLAPKRSFPLADTTKSSSTLCRGGGRGDISSPAEPRWLLRLGTWIFRQGKASVDHPNGSPSPPRLQACIVNANLLHSTVRSLSSSPFLL